MGAPAEKECEKDINNISKKKILIKATGWLTKSTDAI